MEILLPQRLLYNWLPRVDTNRAPEAQEIQLLIPLYRKRGKRFFLSLDEPFAPDPAPEPIVRKNMVAEALRFQAYLKEDALCSYFDASYHFGVTRARVSQLMGIVIRLPEEFLNSMRNCNDPNVLKIFSGQELIRISKLPTLAARQEAIDTLRKTLPNADSLSQ